MKRARTTTRTRRRVRRRTARKPRISRGMPKVSHFALMQKRYQENWAFSPLTTAGFWRYFTFTANQINDWSEFRNVFDEYRINGIKVEMRPCYDSVDLSIVTPSTLLGSVHVAVDPISTYVPIGVPGPGSLNLMLQQAQSVKTYKSDQVVKYYVKPKIMRQVFGGGTAGETTASTWLKCDGSEAVPHRGVHVYIQPYNWLTPTTINYDIFVTYYMQFRGNR